MPDYLTENAAQQVSVRSQLYLCFATAFSYPDETFLDSLTSGEFFDLLVDLGTRLPYSNPFEGAHIDRLQSEMVRQEIKVFYSTVFQSGNQAVPLRELAYSTLTEKALLEELFRFYQHFGLEFSQGELRELPDNLPIELEFLHYLTYLEAEALNEADNHSNNNSNNNNNREALHNAQRDFINLHPGKWVLQFSTRLAKLPDSAVYSSLAELLHQFIAREKFFLSGSREELIALG
jgi:DMSO reductase family type II enzyme chaperone